MLIDTLRSLRSRWWVNGRPGRYWRDVVWPLADENDPGLSVLWEERRDVFGRFDPDAVSDPAARKVFGRETARWRVQTDRVVLARNARVDPRTGIALLGGGRLRETVGIHREVTPRLSSRLADLAGVMPARKVEQAIHFDGFLGRNLWHFFQDAFSALLLVDKVTDLDPATPILIGRQVWETPFARHILGQPPFADRAWIVLDKEWVHVDRLYKGDAAFDWFDATYRQLAPTVAKGGDQRIFLNRRGRYGRTLGNAGQIEAIAAAHGFTTVFAEDLSYAEQARLFAATSVVVGIHGAGLTNCLYADIGRLRCLELQTAGYVNPHYFWLLQQLGVNRYDCLVGSGLDSSGSFRVDAERFEDRLKALLA